MSRESLNDLVAFVTVARERSFTRAAAQLGVSQSALSHSLRGLEARLGVRFAVVGSPACFSKNPLPLTPQDLVKHRCVNLRLSTHGGLYALEFGNEGHEVKVRVEGQVVFNDIFQMIDAAIAGFGLAHIPEETVAEYVQKGKLVSVLQDYCPAWDGHHLYYPGRRQASRALTLVVDALRYNKR